jgi:hypothetical protein
MLPLEDLVRLEPVPIVIAEAVRSPLVSASVPEMVRGLPTLAAPLLVLSIVRVRRLLPAVKLRLEPRLPVPLITSVEEEFEVRLPLVLAKVPDNARV